jgi:hypothetical protein
LHCTWDVDGSVVFVHCKQQDTDGEAEMSPPPSELLSPVSSMSNASEAPASKVADTERDADARKPELEASVLLLQLKEVHIHCCSLGVNVQFSLLSPVYLYMLLTFMCRSSIRMLLLKLN